MGTGCFSTPKKFNECSDQQKVSSNCVLYQGKPIPALGICTGDTLTEVEEVILDTITQALKSINIDISDVSLSNCAEISNMLNGIDKNAATLFSAILTYSCSLKTLVNNYIASQQFSIDLKCITATDDTKIPSIVQGLINFSCNLQSQIDNLTTIVNDTTIISDTAGNILKNGIVSCNSYGIKKTGSGATSQVELFGFMIPFGAIPYFGPISWFDNTGKGLSNSPACGWYLCNGNNGTIDMRGFVPVGAIQGMGGGALDSLVDPAVHSDASMNYSLNSKGGVTKVSLTSAQNGPHTHTITDPGHTHGYQKGKLVSNSDSSGQPDLVGGEYAQTDLAFTGITIGSSGTGAPHENRMPYKAVYWVTRLNN